MGLCQLRCAVERLATGRYAAPLWAVAYHGMGQDFARIHTKYFASAKVARRNDLLDDDNDNLRTSTANVDALAARVDAAAEK